MKNFKLEELFQTLSGKKNMHEDKTSLIWKKYPVLNDGFICLVDVMGDDFAIAQAARGLK